jgi:hypothetical protein
MSLSRSLAHHFCRLAEAQRSALRGVEIPCAGRAESFCIEIFAAVFGPLNDPRTT